MNLLNLGKGYLTYIVALAMVVVGLWHGLNSQDWTLVVQGLGLFGLRRAVS